MQNLLLGVNAHINYDLPLALYDCLYSDWTGLDETQRRSRQNDHETVNQVIGDTIDAVQDTVVEPLSPTMALVESRIVGYWKEGSDCWKRIDSNCAIRSLSISYHFQARKYLIHNSTKLLLEIAK